MITETEMYWLTRMYYLHVVVLTYSIVITVLSAAWLIVSGICHAINLDNSIGGYARGKELLPITRKSLKLSIPCFLLSWILVLGACFIPTTKEICAIKAIPVIVNNEQVQELPNKVVELANEWIDELKPSKDNE